MTVLLERIPPLVSVPGNVAPRSFGPDLCLAMTMIAAAAAVLKLAVLLAEGLCVLAACLMLLRMPFANELAGDLCFACVRESICLLYRRCMEHDNQHEDKSSRESMNT